MRERSRTRMGIEVYKVGGMRDWNPTHLPSTTCLSADVLDRVTPSLIVARLKGELTLSLANLDPHPMAWIALRRSFVFVSKARCSSAGPWSLRTCLTMVRLTVSAGRRSTGIL